MNTPLLSILCNTNDDYLDRSRGRFDELLARAQRLGRAGSQVAGARAVGYEIEYLVSAFTLQPSRHYRAKWISDSLNRAVAYLSLLQYDHGGFDTDNRQSPPDTAFVLRSLAASLSVIRMEQSADLGAVAASLQEVITRGAELVVTGGVHTPNHRWIVCDALARTNALAPDARYVSRIDEWLSEGIDIDADGHYSERSVGIYSAEVDRALISISSRLERPLLLEPVRRNLRTTLFFVEPDGELQTAGSRRQDQNASGHLSRYYLPFRYLANRDSDEQFRAVAVEIERIAATSLRGDLINILADEGGSDLSLHSAAAENAAPAGFHAATFEKHFRETRVVRFRDGERSATIFGGTDWPRGVASGLSSNPTLFTYRNGSAILESVRLAVDFFSKGYFRSSELTPITGGYRLHGVLEAPYYQPLPPERRRADGLYELTPAEDRFYSRMSFPLRAMSEVRAIEITVDVRNLGVGRFQLAFRVDGCDNVPVAVEFTFRNDGVLRGVTPPLGEPGVYGLASGFATFEHDGHAIEFGPGTMDFPWGDEILPNRPHFLRPVPGGATVFVTGHTPFEHAIEVR